MPKSALVAGASGLVGGELLQALLQGTDYEKVTVLVRRPLPLSHPKLEQRIIDFDDPQSFAQPMAVDDVFCCLGTTMKVAGSREAFKKVDFDYPVQLARLAKLSQAKTYLLVSSLGAASRSRIFYSQVKGQTEEAITQVGIPSVHIFRPSMLGGERQESRSGEGVGLLLAKLISPILVGPLRKYRLIQAKTVARAMHEAAASARPGIYIYESHEVQRMGEQP